LRWGTFRLARGVCRSFPRVSRAVVPIEDISKYGALEWKLDSPLAEEIERSTTVSAEFTVVYRKDA